MLQPHRQPRRSSSRYTTMPPNDSHYRPHSLHHTERPSARKPPIGRRCGTPRRKAEAEPRRARFKPVEDQHRCDGSGAERGECSHSVDTLAAKSGTPRLIGATFHGYARIATARRSAGSKL